MGYAVASLFGDHDRGDGLSIILWRDSFEADAEINHRIEVLVDEALRHRKGYPGVRAIVPGNDDAPRRIVEEILAKSWPDPIKQAISDGFPGLLLFTGSFREFHYKHCPWAIYWLERRPAKTLRALTRRVFARAKRDLENPRLIENLIGPGGPFDQADSIDRLSTNRNPSLPWERPARKPGRPDVFCTFPDLKAHLLKLVSDGEIAVGQYGWKACTIRTAKAYMHMQETDAGIPNEKSLRAKFNESDGMFEMMMAHAKADAPKISGAAAPAVAAVARSPRRTRQAHRRTGDTSDPRTRR